MGGFLTDDDLNQLQPADEVMFPSPIPTQVVSSDEFWPMPQTEKQKAVEARIKEMADEIGAKQGLGRRRFLQTASGMAAAFLAMNEVHGPLYAVSRAEAQQPDAAAARAAALKDQFIMDVHTHFLRPDTRIMTFVNARRAVGRAGWNPDLVGKEQTIQDLMEASWFKEVFLDSDTKVALISGAPSEEPIDWFLTISHPVSLAGWRRLSVPSNSSSPTASRAIRLATIPISIWPSIRGAWMMKSCSILSMNGC